jgi:hypothetical protein
MCNIIPLDANMCHFFECWNNGTCTNTNSSFDCGCNEFYTGEFCEEGVLYIHMFLSKKLSFCIKKNISKVRKTRQALFFLSFFSVSDINECVVQPDICKNGGTCENLCGGYRCHCTPGNAGDNCDTGIYTCNLKYVSKIHLYCCTKQTIEVCA